MPRPGRQEIRYALSLLLVLVVGASLASPAGAQVNAPRISCPNYTVISQTASAIIIPKLAGANTYICSLILIANQPTALVEGTGSACGTGTAGMAGGTTAATGFILASTSTLNLGDGTAPVMKTATKGDDVCLLQAGTPQVSGVVNWVQLPF